LAGQGRQAGGVGGGCLTGLASGWMGGPHGAHYTVAGWACMACLVRCLLRNTYQMPAHPRGLFPTKSLQVDMIFTGVRLPLGREYVPEGFLAVSGLTRVCGCVDVWLGEQPGIASKVPQVWSLPAAAAPCLSVYWPILCCLADLPPWPTNNVSTPLRTNLAPAGCRGDGRGGRRGQPLRLQPALLLHPARHF
jgi:hypothetical protein